MTYFGLYLSYGIVSMLVLLVVQKGLLWQADNEPEFKQPWKEFFYVFLAGLTVIVIGQVYVAGYLFSKSNILLESVNQVLIFSPVLILLWGRHKEGKSAWISRTNFFRKIITGLILAIIAIYIYSRFRNDRSILSILADTYALKNLPLLIQVLMEDIVIAMLLVRLKQATSLPVTLVVVSLIFAAGHIPSMVANDLPIDEFYSLFLDAGLGVFVCFTLISTKDILWFWMVHFAMDMMQFYA